MTGLKRFLTLSPFKISVGYFVFGVVWIPSTDVLLALLFEFQQMPTLVGVAKGWFFIGFSAFIVYSLSSVYRRQMSSTQSRLEAANQQLQVLHRVFRHNIRNDLNAIRGYTELVSNNVTNEKAERHLKTVEDVSERVITISEKLKVVEEVNPSPSSDNFVELTGIVTTEIDRIRRGESAIEITTELPNRMWIEGDDSIRYAIREALENAVTHNDKETCEIEIVLERADQEVHLTIVDNGPGVPAAELESIQSGRETPLVHASSVGLWLIRWVCQLHGGRVRFTADASAGTTVSFYFEAGQEATILNTESQIREKLRTIVP